MPFTMQDFMTAAPAGQPPAAQPPAAMVPPAGAAQQDQFMANLARTLAANNTAPQSPVFEPTASMPQTFEEALVVIQAKDELINQLKSQLRLLTPDGDNSVPAQPY